jgi:DNA-binding Xre family transcriptional regulator
MLFVFTACEKEKEASTVTQNIADKEAIIRMRYAQTQCNDQWGNASETSPQVIIDYYKTTHDIEIKKAAFITVDSLATVCAACSCTTGKMIHVDAMNKDKIVMETTGFKE